MEETKIRKVFTRELSFLMGIFAVIIPIVIFIFQIRQNVALMEQEIETIKNNHLHTIEKDIGEINVTNKEQQKKLEKINLKLEKLINYGK